MPRQYFPSKFQLDSKLGYFLWSSDATAKGEQDQVWTRNGFAPTFSSLTQVQNFAREQVGVELMDEGEPLLHDLSCCARWLRLSKQRRARQVRPVEFLEAWNIFADLARRLNVPFSGDLPQHEMIYGKIFWANNLPSVTPPGQFFAPAWTGAQLRAIHDVLAEGLKLWRERVR